MIVQCVMMIDVRCVLIAVQTNETIVERKKESKLIQLMKSRWVDILMNITLIWLHINDITLAMNDIICVIMYHCVIHTIHHIIPIHFNQRFERWDVIKSHMWYTVIWTFSMESSFVWTISIVMWSLRCYYNNHVMKQCWNVMLNLTFQSTWTGIEINKLNCMKSDDRLTYVTICSVWNGWTAMMNEEMIDDLMLMW